MPSAKVLSSKRALRVLFLTVGQWEEERDVLGCFIGSAQQ